jgi:glycosyltransferase involved in cell wall biosynthesis
VPEIVDDGETGFVCETDDEMVEAVGRLGRVDRHACRRTFERRFSVEHMADAYEAVYERACGDVDEPLELPRFASAD